MVRKAHAVARQLVEMGRDDVLVPVTANRSDGLVVGEEENHVRPISAQRESNAREKMQKAQ